MSQPFVGEIRAFGFNFQTTGWLFCDGQTLPIQQYSALFAVIGTTYGGNGTTNFLLPDLRGRAAMHWGNGAGLTPRVIGEVEGSSTVTLTQTQMPAHMHTINAAGPASTAEQTNVPGPTAWIGNSGPDKLFDNAASPPPVMFAPQAISPQGSSLPHQNMQPYQVLNYCIAYEGLFPSRN